MAKTEESKKTNSLLRKVIREALELDWERRIYMAPDGEEYEFLPGGLEYMPIRNAVMIDDEKSTRGILVPAEAYLEFADLLKSSRPKEFSKLKKATKAHKTPKSLEEPELDKTVPFKT